MPQDTKYQSVEYLFQSRGIIARYITDRAPEFTYLNLDGALEREEASLSSTYGTTIINRDPDDTVSGVNYLLPNRPVSLSRLVNAANGNTWRYVADDEGFLYRRFTDTQGPYSQIAANLSGQPFTAVTNTCFASSTPYLFIADAAMMLKDNGAGTPSRIGIVPPWLTASFTPYAPKVLVVENFLSASGFTHSNTTPGAGTIGAIVSGTQTQAVNNFIHYLQIVSGGSLAFDGVFGVPTTGPSTLALLFDIYGVPSQPQFSGYSVAGGAIVAGVNTFTMKYVGGAVAASTTATIQKTVNLDLSQNNQVTDDDLIVLTMQVTNPDNVQQINVLFDLNGSGYVNYFTKSISPQNYQSGITGATDPLTTLANEVYQQGLTNGTVDLGTTSAPQVRVFARPDIPTDVPPSGARPQLTPANLSTGAAAWITVYMRRGDFLPVGLAGEQNQTWASVTGWQIQIITNSGSGGTNFAFNGLYLQWGAGPSSFGGIGYDYRYTYFNFATGTESNGSPIAAVDPQYGYVETLGPLIVLRQAINVMGQYSPDPQVTHVQVYRRGGTYGSNWYYLDRFPNVTGVGNFNYKDIIPDENLSESDVLILDNDVPVTSTLPNPIYTTLRVAPTNPGATSVYWPFGPIQIQVTDSTAVFTPGQIVDVGNPYNLEQTTVQQGGTGQFYAVLRLIHQAGEPVQVFSTPAMPVDLVELAYGQMWWAGDPNNPHFLYYSKEGYPENCGPQNYIPVSQPNDPIMAIINFRGTLYAATLTTWYIIVGGGGQTPYAQPTGSKHGLVAKHGWTKTESAIWYEAIDGIREFRGADGAYRSLPIEWLYRNNPLTPIPLVDLTQLGAVTMAYWQNYVFVSYIEQT